MNKKSSENNFIVEMHIRYQGKVYSLTLARILRWALPLAMIAAKFIAGIHGKSL